MFVFLESGPMQLLTLPLKEQVLFFFKLLFKGILVYFGYKFFVKYMYGKYYL